MEPERGVIVQVNLTKASRNAIVKKQAMLADVEEEQEQDVICFDDITGKELPWHAVRKARESELKYLRDLGSVRESR